MATTKKSTSKPAAKATETNKEKTAEVKTEAPKPVAAKTAAAKPAAAKVETSKPAEVKTAAAKPAAVKTEAPKPAAAKAETPKPAAAKAETTKADVKAEALPEKKIEIDLTTKPKEAKAEVKKEEKKAAEKRRILFVCSEAFPFAGTGGLGEVMGSLPKAINDNEESGYEARLILPLYDSFPADERKNLEFICHINVPLAWRNQYCGLFKYNYKGTVYYFIDNEYYFKRPNLYGYYDDGERFAFLSRAVTELIPSLGWKPDVLHCQDWQTALVPIYYKLFYMYREGYSNIRTIFTIHNIEYQGKYSKSIIEDVFGIPAHEYMSLEHRGCINLMKGAVDYADAISTVSPTYAQEIMDPFYAHGLENVLLKNSYKLRGILNGVDVDGYNPKTNPALFKNYDVDTVKDKTVNKTELQKMLSLPVNENVPMIAIISRLVTHKGLDLIRFAMNDMLKNDVQIVILGKGDPDYENFFTHIQKMYDKKVCSIIAFNKDLSHKIYSAADMFLMPSKSEPCGLSQMMACRYGTIPIVRLTGGLKDSITDCGDGDYGNGFTFQSYNAGDMMHAVDRAVGLYNDYRYKWDGLVKRAMETDFSWKNSAREYIKFYNELF